MTECLHCGRAHCICMTNESTPASQPSWRLIPDAECAQGKCACTTTGCYEVCSLKRVVRGTLSVAVTVASQPSRALDDIDKISAYRPEPKQSSPARSDMLDAERTEAYAFEEWASRAKYDMSTHPLHWLFLNERTYAARQGWKAALDFAAQGTPTGMAESAPSGETIELPKPWPERFKDGGISRVQARDQEIFTLRNALREALARRATAGTLSSDSIEDDELFNELLCDYAEVFTSGPGMSERYGALIAHIDARRTTATNPASDDQDVMALEMKRLHDALCFWLPQSHGGLPDAMQERISADAYLLVGYDDMPDKQSAEELGWIVAGTTAPIPVARVTGSDTVIGRERRSLEWQKGVKAFDFEPGTVLYAIAGTAAPAPFYQVWRSKHLCWLDVQFDTYSKTAEDERRIVYRAATAVPGDLAAKFNALSAEYEAKRQAADNPDIERIYLGARDAFAGAAHIASNAGAAPDAEKLGLMGYCHTMNVGKFITDDREASVWMEPRSAYPNGPKEGEWMHPVYVGKPFPAAPSNSPVGAKGDS